MTFPTNRCSLERLAVVVCLLAVLTPLSLAQEQPSGYPHRITMTAEGGQTVEFAYEYIVDAESGIFHTPSGIDIGPFGRQYYTDAGDGDIKVFDADNAFLFKLGGTGPAPGQWTSMQDLSVSPDRRIYIWDDQLSVFHVFSYSGEYLHRVSLLQQLDIESVTWTSPTEMLVSGLSLSPGFNGFLVHQMRITEVDSRLLLVRDRSFVESPVFEPGLYVLLAGARLLVDFDGGLLVSNLTAHRVRKIRPDATVVWELSDSQIFPDAAASLSVTPSGNVRVESSARLVGLLSLPDWIVQVAILNPEDLPERPAQGVFGPEDIDLSDVVIPKVLEFIDREYPTTGRRIVVRTEEDFVPLSADQQGRVYGFIDLIDPRPVRGLLMISS